MHQDVIRLQGRHQQALPAADVEELVPQLCTHELLPERFRCRQQAAATKVTTRESETVLPDVQ